jgi:hypothetical protein
MNTSIQPKRRRNTREVQELISRYRASTLSQAEFVRQEGICLATLHNYLKRVSNGSIDVPGRFVEVERTALLPDFGRSNYKITCASGVAIEIPAGFCAHEVASLLELVLSLRAQ